jgi:TetR/AcrR family transcriptional regulator, transcriptional repressor for nem operon
MAKSKPSKPVPAKEKLLHAATDLFRRNGYPATTVDEICEQAGVTKGAFFHHFKSKEALAEACLCAWDEMAVGMEQGAPFQKSSDPLKRALGYMDFYLGLFQNPKLLKSCLAGTTVQDVADTNPKLRDAANVCFVNAGHRFRALLDAACKGKRRKPDTASLAALWMATLQGALILCKASQDESVIPKSLEHVKQYIRGLLDADS